MTKAHLNHILAQLQSGLIERDEAARAMLLALLAGEHVLLVGPPGAAKSQLARRLSHVVAHTGEGMYFERLLTKFSVPEELFGPLSIKALEADRFERKTRGFLPQAQIAFIDEVFKASSAILNTLLLMLNERVFDNGDVRHQVPLMTVVAASNEVPKDEALAAFYDRFALRVQVAAVSDDAFMQLLQLRDIPPVHQAVITQAMLTQLLDRASTVRLSDPLLALLQGMRGFVQGQGWQVSDRRWRKLVHLMRVAAAAHERDEALVWDGLIATHVLPATPEQAPVLMQWIAEQLGVWQAYDAPRFTKVIEAFEATLEQEKYAQEVRTLDGDTSSGKGQFMSNNNRDSEVSTESMRLQSPLMRQRLYGAQHIATRQTQVRELVQQLDEFSHALQLRRDDIAQLRDELFVPPAFVPQALQVLQATQHAIAQLHARAQGLIAGFAHLPRMPEPAMQPLAAQS
jgi:MoxR-like ATPase